MEIHSSARKHGVAGIDIRYAVEHALVAYEIEDDEPRRTLYLGPDRANNMLEIVVLEFDDGEEMAIHAMKMRSSYAAMLLEVFGDGDGS